MSMDDAAKKLAKGVRNEGALQNVYRALEAINLRSPSGEAQTQEAPQQGMSWEAYRQKFKKK